MERNLPHYRLLQLGAPDRNRVQRNEEFNDLDGLVTHHPDANRNADVLNGVVVQPENSVTRTYAVVGGEIQEIEAARTDEYRALGRDQVLLVKDFILEDSRIGSGQRGVRQVDVPAPMAGYIGRVDAANGVVDILNGRDGEVIARARHLHPIAAQVGDTIEYGQSLGTQNRQGLNATAGKHVHFEIDTRYYQQYENYIADLASGRLAIDSERQTQGIEARPVVDDGVIRIGESAGIVQQVQQRLNDEGFRGADNRPLEVDGVYRLSMQAAVINFQEAHGLRLTGDIDAATLQEIAPRVFPPRLNDERPGEFVHPGFPALMNRQGVAPTYEPHPRAADDPLLAQAERAVRTLDASLGREYDNYSACLAASSACLAKANGLSRIDQIVLSESRDGTTRGERLFVVQNERPGQLCERAMMTTQEAVSTPVEQSLAKLEELSEAQQREASARAMEEPRRQVGPQMGLG